MAAMQSTSSDNGSIAGEATIARQSAAGGDAPAPAITLYGAWFCPFVQRAWAALEEKGAPYKWIEIDPYRPPEAGSSSGATKIALTVEEKRAKYPEFVNASPRGLIPALERGASDRVCESMVCVEYVDEAFPAASEEASFNALMPPLSDPGARARCRYWCTFASERIIPHYYKLLMAPPEDAAADGGKGGARAAASDAFLMGLKDFAAAMDPVVVGVGNDNSAHAGGAQGSSSGSSGAYFFGATYSSVDFCLAPWVQRALSVLKEYRGLHIPGFETFNDDLEEIQGNTTGESSAVSASVVVGPEYLRLAQWYHAVRSRPSFAATAVDRQRLIQNYSGYANGTATSDAAQKTGFVAKK